jgi:integrase
MERNEVLIRLPQIYDCGGRFSSGDDWFIEFYVRNPRNNKLVRFKKYKGINKYHSLNERRSAAEKMKQLWTNKLKAGWSPFIDDTIIYADNLEYQTFVKNYRTTKSKNGTFRYFASKYIDSIKSNIEHSTVITYRSKLRLFNEWLEGRGYIDVDVSVITRELVTEFMQLIIDELKRSKSTVDNYRILLDAVFNYIRKERKQFPNPCFDLPGTKRINDSAAYPIHESDIPVFKKEIVKRDPQLWLAVCFEYYCFLRPRKEIRLLKISDIDFARHTIIVRYENAKANQRIVTIPKIFMKELKEVYQLHTAPRSFFVIGRKGKPGSTHLCINELTDRFRTIRDDLNMPKEYKLYSWKHTGNIRADEARISRRALQEQNGHVSMVTTEIYMKNKKGTVSAEILEDFPEI